MKAKRGLKITKLRNLYSKRRKINITQHCIFGNVSVLVVKKKFFRIIKIQKLPQAVIH